MFQMEFAGFADEWWTPFQNCKKVTRPSGDNMGLTGPRHGQFRRTHDDDCNRIKCWKKKSHFQTINYTLYTTHEYMLHPSMVCTLVQNSLDMQQTFDQTIAFATFSDNTTGGHGMGSAHWTPEQHPRYPQSSDDIARLYDMPQMTDWKSVMGRIK